jgi:hypothetical protein
MDHFLEHLKDLTPPLLVIGGTILGLAACIAAATGTLEATVVSVMMTAVTSAFSGAAGLAQSPKSNIGMETQKL